MRPYTFYVDESGDVGTDRVRSAENSGASPYMTLGGALVGVDHHDTLQGVLSELSQKIKPESLHCCKLDHFQKVFFARTIGQQPLTSFGVISLKDTLGDYKNAIGQDPWRYYHKCAQYLLERLGAFLKEHNIPAQDVDIVFEDSNHIRLDQFKTLIRKCQKNPANGGVAQLRHITTDNITTRTKDQEPLLKLADLVAHSLFQCVDKRQSNHCIPETRYLKELRKTFHADPETGVIIGYGIKAIHSLDDLSLDPDVKGFLQDLTRYDPTSGDDAI